MDAPTFDRWRTTGQTFPHRGHSIFFHVDRESDRPVLVCIHGFPTGSWDWHLLWPELVTRYRVVALDMIGFGFSAKPRRYRYSIFDQADLHEALLERLGIERFHILAHDYGDTVAQELLARYEERRGVGGPRIESICFLNGGLFPETHRAARVQKVLAGPFGFVASSLMNERRFVDGFARIFGTNTRPDARELSEFWQLVTTNDGHRIAHKLIAYMAERVEHRERWVGSLVGTSVPVRFVNGVDDPISGAHMVARYRDLIPKPDVVELPGIGHYPQVEAPEAVLRAYAEFRSKCGA